MKSTPYNETPALARADCRQDTHQGLIYPVSPLAWHLLPQCDEQQRGEPEPKASDIPISERVLEQWISEHLIVVRHLQRTRRRIARAYMQLRKYHTHTRAERALRRQLRRLCSAWAMEGQR